MMNELLLPPAAWRQMRRHVARRAPLEACGLLAGHGSRVDLVLGTRNAERSPFSFRISPAEQLRVFNAIERLGLDLVGIYHSHPNGPEMPSPSDIRQAFYNVCHLVWWRKAGEWQVGAWWIESGQVTAVQIVQTGRE